MAAAALVTLVGTGSVRAHHSIGMFELSSPIWVKGTVIAYEPIAPHAMIYLEETTADGQVRNWRVEGPWPGRLGWILEQHGIADGKDFFKPGDVIEVCGFDFKAEIKAQRAPSAGDPSVSYAHGQMVVMADGQMRSWGGYGKLVNCVRPDDSIDTWREFLNVDHLARALWCAGRNQVQAATIAPQEFLDEVSAKIDEPCE
jgi:hypothetical protein